MIIYIIFYLVRFFKGINNFLIKFFFIRNIGLIVIKFVVIFFFILILGKCLYFILLSVILMIEIYWLENYYEKNIILNWEKNGL